MKQVVTLLAFLALFANKFSFAKKDSEQNHTSYRIINRKGKPLSDRKIPEYNKKMLNVQEKHTKISTAKTNYPSQNHNIPKSSKVPSEQTISDYNEVPQKQLGFQSLDSINFNESLNIPKAKEMVLNQQNVSYDAKPKRDFRPPQKDYFIKAGVFKKQSEAHVVARRLSSSLKMPIEPELVASKNQYVINIGPFSEKKDAEVILADIVRTGYSGCKIVDQK